MYTATPAPPTPSATQNDTISPHKTVPAVVYWIGLTSLLTDISSEMVASILPVFMFTVLQLSALQVGFFDGLYQGGAALVRVMFAYWADKYRNPKTFALLGYGLSFVAKILLIVSAVGGMLFVLVSLLIDRVGKGMRTAPRDALIAQHSDPARMGASFGVHRSMDAAGALIGPFIALGFLLVWTQGFEALFALSAAFALAGLAVLWLKVKPTSHSEGTAAALSSNSNSNSNSNALPQASLSIADAARLLMRNPAYLQTLCIASLLSVFTISDGLFYLNVQQQTQMPASTVTALFAGSATVFMLTASFIGRLADRTAPLRLFIGSYAVLWVLYVAWMALVQVFPQAIAPSITGTTSLSATQVSLSLGIVVLMGLFYGANEGILMASLVRQLPSQVLTTGLALFTTVQGLVKIASSTLYGWMWQTYGTPTANAVFALGLTLAMSLAVWIYHTKIKVKT